MPGFRVAAAVAVVIAAGTAATALDPGPGTRPTRGAAVIRVRTGVAVPVDTPAPDVLYEAPVEPLTVVRGFDPPSQQYGPGHLGVDIAVAPRAPVYAAAAGTVSFAGSVAGRGVVVVAHADGISTEYEPLRPAVAAGQTVALGQLLGHVDGTHGTCPPDRCLHWGARRGATYLDPLQLLANLGPPRLLPWR